MPISIRMKPGFMYFGTTKSAAEATGTAQGVPMPNSEPFTTNFNLRSQNAADGSTVYQIAGLDRSVQSMTWYKMDAQTWWTLCAWIKTNGPVVWAHYFDYNMGAWATRRFVVLSISCSPYRPGAASNNTNHGKPLYLENCTFTVSDIGAGVTA